MKILFALVLGLSFAAIGCNQELKKNEATLAYDFDEGGCKTGAHSFSNKTDYCAALKDDLLNNGCAYSTRKAQYETDCGTDWAFWPEQPQGEETAAQ
jgi:hypothetical protein